MTDMHMLMYVRILCVHTKLILVVGVCIAVWFSLWIIINAVYKHHAQRVGFIGINVEAC